VELCPYCAETLPGEVEKCPHCGERLSGEPALVASRPRSALVISFGCLALLVVGGVLVLPLLIFGAPVGPPTRVIAVRPPLPPPLPKAVFAEPSAAATPFAPANALANKQTKAGLATRYVLHAGAGFVFLDLGDVRVAIRGVQAHGTFNGRVLIDPDVSENRSGSRSKGPLVLETTSEGGVTTCVLQRITFTLESSTLTLGSVSVPVFGEKQVILVDPDGSNVTVVPYTGP
jgi:hypothetical protein